MTTQEAKVKYPDHIFVVFGVEDDGTYDTGIYASQEDADIDDENGENKRMVTRLNLEDCE